MSVFVRSHIGYYLRLEAVNCYQLVPEKSVVLAPTNILHGTDLWSFLKESQLDNPKECTKSGPVRPQPHFRAWIVGLFYDQVCKRLVNLRKKKKTKEISILFLCVCVLCSKRKKRGCRVGLCPNRIATDTRAGAYQYFLERKKSRMPIDGPHGQVITVRCERKWINRRAKGEFRPNRQSLALSSNRPILVLWL